MTKEEEILNEFIKGDLKRDYSKLERDHFTIDLNTALKAMRKLSRYHQSKPKSNETQIRQIAKEVSNKLGNGPIYKGDIGHYKASISAAIILRLRKLINP